MKTIGLIGGLTWESTAAYYAIINREVQRRLGGSHSAQIVMYSFDFEDIAALQKAGQWDDARDMMIAAAKRLQRAGADFLVICANTMHRVADAVEWQSRLPVLHIADVVAAKIIAAGMTRVGLLGTAYTMEGDFYTGRLRDKHALTTIVPDAEGRAAVHHIIYDELSRGIIDAGSRATCCDVIAKLADQGAEGVILGCTELPLLVKSGDTTTPLFDTTELHALAAVDLALT